MLIDGKLVPAASGKTFEVYNPATGAVIANVPEADKADVDHRGRRRAACLRRRRWAKVSPLGARAHAVEARRSDRARPRGTGRAGIDRQRQALCGRARRRSAAGGRHVPLHGRLGDQDHRHDDPAVAAGRISVLHGARTGRRRRPDHPVEFPAADGGVEDRPGAGRGLHGRAEGRRTDADDRAAPRRA